MGWGLPGGTLSTKGEISLSWGDRRGELAQEESGRWKGAGSKHAVTVGVRERLRDSTPSERGEIFQPVQGLIEGENICAPRSTCRPRPAVPPTRHNKRGPAV